MSKSNIKIEMLDEQTAFSDCKYWQEKPNIYVGAIRTSKFEYEANMNHETSESLIHGREIILTVYGASVQFISQKASV